MASEVFDSLWEDAFRREGELVAYGAELARVFDIRSAVEACRLARDFHEAGRPFFDYCNSYAKGQRAIILDRMRRQGRLSKADADFLNKFFDKIMAE